MTPALFAGAFRASRFRPAHWRTGCRARLRRPSDLKHHAACREGCGLGPHSGQWPPCTFGASGRGRLTPFLSRRAGLREGDVSLRAGLRLAPLERWATGVACTADLTHHAACREGCGSGAHVGPRPPDTFFLTHHAAPDCGRGSRALGGAFSTSFPAFQKRGCAGTSQSSEKLGKASALGGPETHGAFQICGGSRPPEIFCRAAKGAARLCSSLTPPEAPPQSGGLSADPPPTGSRHLWGARRGLNVTAERR